LNVDTNKRSGTEKTLKGRGAVNNPPPRFDTFARERLDDGWWQEAEASPRTTLMIDNARAVITRNGSPDVPFSQSVNPYRGCEHGCTYCFARPTHAYLGLSPGLDFETKIAWKPDAPQRLREELARPSYTCSPIALGINTDAYQPLERKLGLTRALLEVLAECRHPVSIVTKSALILRDRDLLGDMARDGLVDVMLSVTTLDRELSRQLEPRAATPQRRLATISALREAGIPVGVLVAPVIPAVNDHELERLLEAVGAAGASSAAYVLLRLPHEVAPLFRDWLARHLPDRAAHVMSLLQQMRGGRDNDSEFGTRMRGTGPLADLLSQRFRLACERFGLNRTDNQLNCSRFRPPPRPGAQLAFW
jgi:DNA repair photolyase